MIDLEKLEEKVKEYLLTISDEDGDGWNDEWFDSFRDVAAEDLAPFLDWLKENNDTDSIQ